MKDIYIALGGNQPHSLAVMRKVVARLKGLQGFENIVSSKLYQTSAVSSINQPDYLNAVCRFHTCFSLKKVWHTLQKLEIEMGKKPKPKESPRLIDIDLLFYGSEECVLDDLIVPHERWKERLFVLKPLADVTKRTPLGEELDKIMERFCNPHKEKVSLMSEWLIR